MKFLYNESDSYVILSSESEILETYSKPKFYPKWITFEERKAHNNVITGKTGKVLKEQVFLSYLISFVVGRAVQTSQIIF